MDNFVAIDFETANFAQSSVCSVGLVIVKDGEIVDNYYSLIRPILQKELLPLTGYIRGGCCPIGMKRPFPSYIDETCLLHEKMYVSAGQRGMQLRLTPQNLIEYVPLEVSDLI